MKFREEPVQEPDPCGHQIALSFLGNYTTIQIQNSVIKLVIIKT